MRTCNARLTILLIVLGLLALSPAARATDTVPTSATMVKMHFNQYRYFVRDPIASAASGVKFEWEHCNWSLTFLAIGTDFPVQGATIRISVAGTTDTLRLTALDDATTTTVLDGKFADGPLFKRNGSRSLRLRPGENEAT